MKRSDDGLDPAECAEHSELVLHAQTNVEAEKQVERFEADKVAWHEKDMHAYAEAQIVALVRQGGEGSDHYRRELGEALTELGVGTLIKMLENNRIFDVLERLEIKLARPHFSNAWRKDSRALAHIVVRVTVVNFMAKQILDAEGWDPTRGASLKTFFITACLYTFATEYRKYCAEEGGVGRPEVSVGELPELPDGQQFGPGPPPSPEKITMDRDTINRIIPDAPREVAEAFLLVSRGYTHKEAASILGITSNSLNGKIRRFREKFRRSFRQNGK